MLYMRSLTSSYSASSFKWRTVQFEQRARLRLFRHFMKPVAMREAQKDLEVLPHAALEPPDRIGGTNVEPLQRLGEPVREHQQRRALKVRDQEQQEMLMPELPEHAAFRCPENIWIARHR